MKTKRLPKSITIKFTEKDRQKAEPFQDYCGCIVFTALQRMGYKPKSVGTTSAGIGSQTYLFNRFFGCRAAKARAKAPFYQPSIVGKKLKLTRQS